MAKRHSLEVPSAHGSVSGGSSRESLAYEHIPMDAISRQTSTNTQLSQTSKPKPSRQKSIKEFSRSMKKSVTDFFLVGDNDMEEQNKWLNRSISLAQKPVGGKVRADMTGTSTVDSLYDGSQVSGPSCASIGMGPGGRPHIYDPLAIPRHPPARQDSYMSRASFHRQFSRQISSVSSKRSQRYAPTRRSRKDSVFRMAYDGVRNMVVRESTPPPPEKPLTRSTSLMPRRLSSKKKKPAYMHSRSFTPESISSFMDDTDGLKSPGLDSVFTDDSQPEDVFFNSAAPTSPIPVPRTPQPGVFLNGHPLANALPDSRESAGGSFQHGRFTFPDVAHPLDNIPEVDSASASGWELPVGRQVSRIPSYEPVPEESEPETGEEPAEDTVDGNIKGRFKGMRRIVSKIIEKAKDNSDRREVGKGVVGRYFKRSYRKDRMNSKIERQIDELDDYRPYFTYWVTFVHIVIYLISVSVYGIAPPGFEESEVTAQVIQTSLAIERVSYFEKDNFWIGPRQADLIHLGAKYSPCMRKDENVENAIAEDRVKENNTGCCIRNDGSGCVQSSQEQCSTTLASWNKWSDAEPGDGGRTAGPVCGLDPSFCLHPLSQGAFRWDDDITTWPVCKRSSNGSQHGLYAHMGCEVVGRPCCVGIQGECIITTREYCEFRRGYFHPEAILCSQISCMNEICGMIPFLEPTRPDQFYRLWTALFLHAGLLQLIVSVLFQMFIMRDLEKLAGCLRIAIIYLGSGIAGSISSAIFLPYHVEAGPSGCQFGLIACLVVEVLHNWYILQNPWRNLSKLGMIIFVLFIIGLLPMVDNYAHLVGFIFGFLLSFAFLPHFKIFFVLLHWL